MHSPAPSASPGSAVRHPLEPTASGVRPGGHRLRRRPLRSALAVLGLGALLATVACTRTVAHERPTRDVQFNALGALFNGPWAHPTTTVTTTPVELPPGVEPPPTVAPEPTVLPQGPDPENPILATIRQLESGNNYQAAAPGSSASGAYQMLDEVWAGLYGYPRAMFAPSVLQDIKAAELITSVLTPSDDVSRVPVAWYIGHIPAEGSSEWDIVPAPGAGNILTPRQYQERWMKVYNEKWDAYMERSGGGDDADESDDGG